MDSRVKSLNTDERSRKRLKFTSSKARSKQASADVYRGYKRRIGVTSAATREESVHNPHAKGRAQKRQRGHHKVIGTEDAVGEGHSVVPDDGSSDVENDASPSTFAMELDIAIDRNPSEIFSKLHRGIWPLVRSLPETLHYSEKIVELLLSFLLSNETEPESPAIVSTESSPAPVSFVVNHATTDILHLLAVLARDLRQEIHPYLHKILPRIVNDLLSPPPPPPESGKQPIPLHVSLVEAAFRCLSYILKYDSAPILQDIDQVRQYYGSLLGNRRELIRRLASETLAPLIRKSKNTKLRDRHMKRVIKALSATGKQKESHRMRRMQEDAIDGIAQLIVQLVRGVPGKLHSSARPILRHVLTVCVGYPGKKKSEATHITDLSCRVLEEVMGRLCRFLSADSLAVTLDEVVDVTKSLLSSNELSPVNAGANFSALLSLIKVQAQIVEHESGNLREVLDVRRQCTILECLSEFITGSLFESGSLSQKLDAGLVSCRILKVVQDVSNFNQGLERILNHMLSTHDHIADANFVDFADAQVRGLATTLIPYFKEETSVVITGKIALSVAAQFEKEQYEAALRIVFSFVNHPAAGRTEGDDRFFVNRGRVFSTVDDINTDRLFESCLLDVNQSWTRDLVARLGVSIRCAPVLAIVGCCESKMTAKPSFMRVATWLCTILDVSGLKSAESLPSGVQQVDLVLIRAMALEALSVHLGQLGGVFSEVVNVDDIWKTLKLESNKLLLEQSSSLSAVRAVAAAAHTVEISGKKVDFLDEERVFDLLVPNLSSSSHSFRLHTLEILNKFPKKPYIVDHADLDLTGDLDEEESVTRRDNHKVNHTMMSGTCDVLQDMLELEKTPISVAHERLLIGLVSRMEVKARGGKMPVAYAEALISHSLGVYNIKFASLWPAVTSVVVLLLNSYEKSAWEIFKARLVSTMMMKSEVSTQIEKSTLSEADPFQTYFEKCSLWERSMGKYEESLEKEQDQGTMSSSCSTDSATVMESVWGAAQKTQIVCSKHSRAIVPLFLDFLHNQYFVYHIDDPNRRVLCLHDESSSSPWSRQEMESGVLQRKLQCFLGLFAVTNSPRQLVKHKLLERTFKGFLSHQDVIVARSALGALLKFKLPYLTSYGDLINELVRKGIMNDALLKLQHEVESSKIDEKHKGDLYPLISRVLYGRLFSQGGKKTKDSPKAKRSAILSSLSVIYRDENDIFPFLYLMTRSLAPTDCSLVAAEGWSQENQRAYLDVLEGITSPSLPLVRGSVIEGFLNLSDALVTQFGHRIVSFIPSLMAIILAICQQNAVVGNVPLPTGTAMPPEEGSGAPRKKVIRSLCYQLVSKVLLQFHGVVNLSAFAEPLWSSIEGSICLLPEMAIRSPKTPALLLLVERVSSISSLEMIVQKDSVVDACLRCITSTSHHPIIDTALSFVENQLRDCRSDEESNSQGFLLIRKHRLLLLEQFVDRLGAAGMERGSFARSTRKRELDVLCIVSQFGFEEVASTEQEQMLQTLCELLLPYINRYHTPEEEKNKVIQILKGTIPRMDSESTMIAYKKLATLLAPTKAKRGIESLSVRQGITDLMSLIATKCEELSPVTSMLSQLTAVHSKRVDEVNFDLVIPALAELGGADGWIAFCDDSMPGNAVPVVNSCFHFLHCDDGVLSRSSFNALKALVRLTAEKSKKASNDVIRGVWTRMVESAILPLVRSGLQSSSPNVRRFYILLIREVSIGFKDNASPHLCGDLYPLCDEDNADLDFFQNITHVQIHRKTRALQRLRARLKELPNSSQSLPGAISLSSVVLPIITHPLYESKTKGEELLALESATSVGTVCSFLSWSKYNNVLWTILLHFERYAEQERFLVGTMCAIIDNFHFELTNDFNQEADIKSTKNSVWMALERRIIPKLEGLVSKETVDKNGSKVKSIRSALLLTLLKLFQRFPVPFLEAKLPHLLAVTCDALRCRDSSARDVARTTLAKMVVSMNLKYLPDVIRELSITLNEGYKLHVLAATIHTILDKMSSVCTIPTDGELANSPFDAAVPLLVDVIQNDLFGIAYERRESEETSVRYVKEAAGNKSIRSIELICTMISFKTDLTKPGHSKSAVQCVVSPLLERLRSPSVDARTITRVREILGRVVVGLSHNSNMKIEELLPFTYATIQPFIGVDELDGIVAIDDESDDNDTSKIKVSGKKRDAEPKQPKVSKCGKVTQWRPSTLKTFTTTQEAQKNRLDERRRTAQVRDGEFAPKLTGASRHRLEVSKSTRLSNPATISAVVFGLNLLHSCMKKMRLDPTSAVIAMMDPFVPLLTACVCKCRDTDVSLGGLKCLISMMRFDLPSISSCSKSLGQQSILFLSSNGSSLNQNQDLTQACFRMLTFLIGKGEGKKKKMSSGDENNTYNHSLPLNQDQMDVLLSIMRLSITESEQHNPALALTKVILAQRFVSAEFYELMESLLKAVVRSQKASLRQQSAGIFIRYLLDYPMSEDRFHGHLKQITANVSYEHQEGRLSALAMLLSVIEKVPEALLQINAKLIFLPLVLQLVNDTSKDCRDSASRCLVLLFTRVSTENITAFLDYTSRWRKSEGPLRIASLQVFEMLLRCRIAFFQKQGQIDVWINVLGSLLQSEYDDSDWETPYFSLLGIETVQKHFPDKLISGSDVWSSIIQRMSDNHPWIKLSTSRIVQSMLLSPNVDCPAVLSSVPGRLFMIVRSLCMHMNLDESRQNEELSELAIKSLTISLPLLHSKPELCFSADNQEKFRDRNPLGWVMRRLSQIARPQGSKRRSGVFKCFAAFCTEHPQLMACHLELMLEPIHRANLEANNEVENKQQQYSATSNNGDNMENVASDVTLARDVLVLIEERCDSPEAFLQALSTVKKRARDRKEERKGAIKAEAILDPVAAAQRRIKKQQHEKDRRKRRVAERRQDRGASKKRRHMD